MFPRIQPNYIRWGIWIPIKMPLWAFPFSVDKQKIWIYMMFFSITIGCPISCSFDKVVIYSLLVHINLLALNKNYLMLGDTLTLPIHHILLNVGLRPNHGFWLEFYVQGCIELSCHYIQFQSVLLHETSMQMQSLYTTRVSLQHPN